MKNERGISGRAVTTYESQGNEECFRKTWVGRRLTMLTYKRSIDCLNKV